MSSAGAVGSGGSGGAAAAPVSSQRVTPSDGAADPLEMKTTKVLRWAVRQKEAMMGSPLMSISQTRSILFKI